MLELFYLRLICVIVLVVDKVICGGSGGNLANFIDVLSIYERNNVAISSPFYFRLIPCFELLITFDEMIVPEKAVMRRERRWVGGF